MLVVTSSKLNEEQITLISGLKVKYVKKSETYEEIEHNVNLFQEHKCVAYFDVDPLYYVLTSRTDIEMSLLRFNEDGKFEIA